MAARIAELLGIQAEQVWQKGKSRIQAKARSLLCYLVVRELSESMTAMARRPAFPATTRQPTGSHCRNPLMPYLFVRKNELQRQMGSDMGIELESWPLSHREVNYETPKESHTDAGKKFGISLEQTQPVLLGRFEIVRTQGREYDAGILLPLAVPVEHELD